jgi:tRNA threonylcarbamoyladenosine biosynthesis protein TsaE
MSIVGKNYSFELLSEANCQSLAIQLRNAIPLEKLISRTLHIWFSGDLGSGKTTFIRFFLESLGHHGKVKSPTYNLCEPYQILNHGQVILVHHFDLYRMNHPREWEEAGFKDILTSPGINLIEWPEKAEDTLPSPDLIMSLQYASETKRIGNIESNSELGNKILEAL